MTDAKRPDGNEAQEEQPWEIREAERQRPIDEWLADQRPTSANAQEATDRVLDGAARAGGAVFPWLVIGGIVAVVYVVVHFIVKYW